MDARQYILEYYFRSVGASKFRDLVKLFGWLPHDIGKAVGSLVEKGIIRDHEHFADQIGEWMILTELL
jgi:hypothetical protein